MKAFISFICLFLLAGACAAQGDTLFLKGGQKVPGIFKKAGWHRVYFQREKAPGMLKDASYRNRNVDYILLDGNEIRFVDAFWNVRFREVCRHMMDIDVQPLRAGLISLSYQRLFAHGKMGFRIPLTVNAAFKTPQPEQNYLSPLSSWRYGAGFDLNFFPAGPRMLNWYLGPALRYVQFDAYNDQYHPGWQDYESKFSPLWQKKIIRNIPMAALCFQNGLLLYFTRNIYLDASAGFGPGVLCYNSQVKVHAYFFGNVRIGYSFGKTIKAESDRKPED